MASTCKKTTSPATKPGDTMAGQVLKCDHYADIKLVGGRIDTDGVLTCYECLAASMDQLARDRDWIPDDEPTPPKSHTP